MNTVRRKQKVAGSTLKRKRRSLGLSIAETARLLRVSENTYRQWEEKNGGIEAIPFASGDWDKVVRLLGDSNAKPFLEAIGKLHSILKEDNLERISASLDSLSSKTLARFFATFRA